MPLFVKSEGGKTGASRSPPQAFIGPKGTILTFHFSNIPSFQSIVSAANLSSKLAKRSTIIELAKKSDIVFNFFDLGGHFLLAEKIELASADEVNFDN